MVYDTLSHTVSYLITIAGDMTGHDERETEKKLSEGMAFT
jgi:hypothetical protein